MKNMTAIIKEVGKPLEVKEVPNVYETLKTAVGGWIEAVYLDKDVILWINEEGKLIGLPHNFTIKNISIEGNVIFTGRTPDGDNKSLSEAQIKYVKSLLEKKATAYQKYIDTFFEEKDLETEVWTFTREDNGFNLIRQIDTKTVIAYLRSIPEKPIQKKVRDILLHFDFTNRNVNIFLKDMAKFIFEKNI